MLVAAAELIADVGRDTWFDAARTEADQYQPGYQPVRRVARQAHARQRRVAEAVNDAQQHDRAVFP
jgi:hypothetical protein